MSSYTLKRLGGLSGIVAGSLLIIAAILDQILHMARIGTIPLVAVLFNTLFIVSGILTLFALTAVYSHQSSETGSFGITGFASAFTGWILMTGYSYASAYAIPAFMLEAPALREVGSLSPLGEAEIVTISLFILGNLLFAISSHKAGVFRRWSTVLLIIGSLLLLVPIFWGVAIIRICIQMRSEEDIPDSESRTIQEVVRPC